MLQAQLRNDWTFWKSRGGGREKPELYGIWNIDTFTVDGRQTPPLTTDGKRWRRVIVESEDLVTVQRMDDSFDNYGAAIDMDGRTISLLRMTDPVWRATMSLQHPTENQLILDGEVDGHRLHMRLHRMSLDSLPLVARRFHWVQENAYWQ